MIENILESVLSQLIVLILVKAYEYIMKHNNRE